MIVKVTQQHIDNGVVGNPRRCAIALALKEVLDIDYVDMDGFNIGDVVIPFPVEVSEFILGFDSNPKQPQPFSFEL